MPNDTPAGPEGRVDPPPWASGSRSAGRASGAALGRDRIVEAALAIVDAEGPGSLSIRRLTADLGVSPMAVYWYVRDKAELLDLVGEAVLSSMTLPEPTGDWRADLRAIHLAMRDGFLRHPGTADLMIGRARYGTAGIAMFERLLGILLHAGLTPEDALDAYGALYQYTLGWIATASRDARFREVQAEGVAYLRSLDPAVVPSIAAVAPVIGRRPPSQAYEIGLDLVIDGIAARQAPAG